MSLWRLPWLLVRYTIDLVSSNLVLAREVARPRQRLVAGIVAVDITVTGWRLVLLTNLITLTPGTLSLDVSDDGRTLYVHFLDPEGPGQAREGVRQLERRVTEVFGR